MTQQRLHTAALVAATAVGAAQLVLSVRQHRDRCHLATAAMRQELAIAEAAGADADTDAAGQIMCSNWISTLAIMYRTRVITRTGVRVAARHLMRTDPRAMPTWEGTRDWRRTEARDKCDRQLIAEFDAAYEREPREPSAA
ncbi:hypothetical protein [Streptomyces celluloflavus]|uniref:hypothetical protein n=1 Tax=Streptomyces celluloflavus TaxID=58344 RepID=UPI0036B5161F